MVQIWGKQKPPKTKKKVNTKDVMAKQSQARGMMMATNVNIKVSIYFVWIMVTNVNIKVSIHCQDNGC